MPDDLDYAWLDEFLNAREWSEEDHATAQSLLTHQLRALAEADPRDERTRQRLQGVIAELEQAIKNHPKIR